MPKTTAEMARDLARLSSDCSFLLTHLVRQNDGRSGREARQILESILDLAARSANPKLMASQTSWYGTAASKIYNPATGTFNGTQNNLAVCFTESTLAGLKAHRDVFSANYGVAFDRDYLFGEGANPCLNIQESLLKEKILCPGERYPRRIFNFIPAQLHPFVNIIHESFDATHEREWRIARDLRFNYKNLMFVFCPSEQFPRFSRIQSHGRPVLFDLAWLDRI
ncbi:MAG: hypothetical protein HOO98_19685 [Nitrospira sp.]|nr:hypothetical protein [Nitrospira sp.]